MGTVIDLGAWRADREPEARLQRALDDLERALAGREGPPAWVATQMLAALGCRHLGLLDEAAERLERAVRRLTQERRRARRSSGP